MESSSRTTRHELDKQLSFALYGATGRMVRLHKPFLDPLGLTFPQYLVMVELLDRSPRSVGELGARVGMDTGTITPLVKRLEIAGLITRRRDARDARRVLVALTSAGEALREGVWAVPGQIMSACKITDAQAEELRAALDSMAQSAEY
ncbi:MarR family winged helix-turn-helix transcriptional regulator [Agrobacterium sp. 22094]|uniref:MarR family winged helix-turn-helix transcriptional regulator n=1 Tax=Agrobacterium sp. 22094 TaxID=3453872 RepID=UPI003F853295